MRPTGRRNRRITFQEGIPSVDPDSGAMTYNPWVIYFSSWAERKDLTGTELFRAQQLVAKVSTEYRIPYPYGKDLTPRESLRILDQRHYYDVTWIGEVGLRGREGLLVYAFARADQPIPPA